MVDENGRILTDKLSAEGYSPGYRDFSFDVIPAKGKKIRVDLSIEDALKLAREILVMHDLAWSEEGPIDANPNEIKPQWVDEYPNRPYYGRLYKRSV